MKLSDPPSMLFPALRRAASTVRSLSEERYAREKAVSSPSRRREDYLLRAVFLAFLAAFLAGLLAAFLVDFFAVFFTGMFAPFIP